MVFSYNLTIKTHGVPPLSTAIFGTTSAGTVCCSELIKLLDMSDRQEKLEGLKSKWSACQAQEDQKRSLIVV